MLAQRPQDSSRPTTWDTVLFFLLFSGPPKFRLRDPGDSLDNVIDWVVLLHVAVWALAGLWIVSKLWLSKPKLDLRFSLPEKLSLLLVCCLSVSVLYSEGPGLTSFKVYQLLATILFVSVFTRRYGIGAGLDGILVGSMVLCAADVVAALARIIREGIASGVWSGEFALKRTVAA